MDIVLILLVGDGNVAVRGVDGIRRWASWFYLRDKDYLIMQGVLMIAHGDSHTSMLPSSVIGLKFSCISDALLVNYQ